MILDTFKQIDNLVIDPSKPLLIVDADEVLVLFAKHFSNYLKPFGWELKLKGYRLDDAITNIEGGHVADKITYQKLISAFIREETIRQPEATDASKTLEIFKNRANIIILTNVPNTSYKDRVRNLTNMGMNYPVVSNIGHKGPALKKLKDKTEKVCVFIDDNPFQIESASNYAPEIYRFHFTACELVKKTMPIARGATHRPDTWSEIMTLLSEILP